MTQMNLNDSDCFIEEPNITIITLNDSTNETDEDEPSPAPPYNQIIEDGEVLEIENDNKQNDTICEIKFPSKTQFKQFGILLTNSLKNILKNHLNQQFGKVFEIVEEVNENYVQLTVQEEKRLQYSVGEIPMPQEKPKAFEKDASPDLSGISELFTIDTAPTPKIDTVKVPSYKRAIKDALLDEEAAAQKRKKEVEDEFKLKKVTTCFNCGETGHSIRECSKPHNAKRIKSAKRSAKVERYHVDIEQRLSHLKPGCISDKLREALGLRKGEIPFFFYRMRVLGYPPGWLEDAKVEHSGINLFNSDGTKILQPDDDEGELINHKYNLSKIFDFPGFNQHPGANFYDDYIYHNVPPLNKGQMKEEFIKTLGDNILQGYKRKKFKEFPNTTPENNVTIIEVTDMDIEDPEATTLGEVQFTRPPPPSDHPVSPAPPPPPTSLLVASSPSSCESPITVSEYKERESSTQSPSLLELEKHKRRLLRELKSSTIATTETDDSLIDEIIDLDAEDTSLTTEQTCTNTSALADKDTNENINAIIKESFMGTPVLQFSPYNNLPNGENFKVGVSDVINFENLPDSTGKYEQMKEVIKKVRNCVHKLQSEE